MESKITASSNIVSYNIDLIEKFKKKFENRKFSKEELILFRYMLDNGRDSLQNGSYLNYEIENIKKWEIKENISNDLSKNYEIVLGKLKMNKFTEISKITSEGNSKEVKLIDEITEYLLNLSKKEEQIINEIINSLRIAKSIVNLYEQYKGK